MATHNYSDTSDLTTDASMALQDSRAFLRILDDWARAGWIRWLDAEFANFLHRQIPEAPGALLLAAALTSHQNGHGHVCLDILYCLSEPDQALSLPPESPARQPALTPQQLLANIDSEQWLLALQHPALVGHGNQPLVLDHSSGRPLLYLRRFWHYEQTLVQNIQQRLMSPPVIDEKQLKQTIITVFSRLSHKDTASEIADAAADCDWQKIACALATRNRFAIITGGPGTGKTTTVVRLLAVLQEMHGFSANGPLRIRLAAPTGKAAARLSVSISSQLATHDLQGISGEVSTVHRLLGPIRNSRFFRYDSANPLPADVVVVDEASMVDIELMALLLDALPRQARLILLGDKDQLASVEAGAVLGSLCQRAAQVHYTPDTARWIKTVTGQAVPADFVDSNGSTLDQAITMLRYSHRFGAVPGIGELARAVNANAETEKLNACFDGRFNEIRRIKIRSTQDTAFEQLIRDSTTGYGHYLARLKQTPAVSADIRDWDSWALTVLRAQGQFQLLAALRKGEFGVESLNKRIETILQSADLLPSWHSPTSESAGPQLSRHEVPGWYPGRPVMVTRNDYNLDLMNGDIGIALPCPHSGPGSATGSKKLVLRVAFSTADPRKPVRWVLPSRLQSVETVFAMTVHKSQGSEFAHTALILPQYENPVLTRELIYTGITRAAKKFTLIDANPNVLPQAVAGSVFRASGLLHAINSSSLS